MPDKKAAKPTGDPPNGRPAPTRKQGRPRLDAVIRHIKAGSYDDDMSQLQGAIADRQQKRQEAVLALVKQTFGADYAVVPPPAPNPSRADTTRENPFLKDKAPADPELAAAEEAARQREEELKAEMGDGLPEDEDSPDIESRSPIIGSVEG